MAGNSPRPAEAPSPVALAEGEPNGSASSYTSARVVGDPDCAQPCCRSKPAALLRGSTHVHPHHPKRPKENPNGIAPVTPPKRTHCAPGSAGLQPALRSLGEGVTGTNGPSMPTSTPAPLGARSLRPAEAPTPLRLSFNSAYAAGKRSELIPDGNRDIHCISHEYPMGQNLRRHDGIGDNRNAVDAAGKCH